ncbi:MAG TPA: AsmA family protein [Burkholderiales bacterium]|jgi:AsmA protein
MSKPIKYALLGLGALVVLVIAAAAIFAATFDPNKYKGQIEAAVKEKTGRTLKLAGNLELAFWPSLGAKVGGVTLSEKGSDKEFVALDSAHASVAVLPLLHGAVLVDGIRVSGLKANVVKDKQGKFNFSDLLESPAQKPAAEAKPAEPAKGAVAFDIGSVRLERSAVTYRDLASGQEIALSDIDLSTGRIGEKADGKLKFSVSAKGRNPDLDAKVQLAGDYNVDIPGKSYALSGLDGKVTGTMAKGPLDVKLSIPKVDTAGGVVTAPKLSVEVTLPMPDLPQKTLKVNLDGSAKADLDKQSANADLVAKLDESTIQAKLALPKFSPPVYNFDVNIDKLNLDRYMPAQPEGKKDAPSKGAPPSGPPQETPVDLSALKGLNANGKLQIGAFQARGLKVANLKAEVKAANGHADVAPHSAELYQGKVAGALSLNADGNRVALKEDLSGIAIGPLLKDVAQKDMLDGRGNIALDVNAAGPTVEAMKRALAGTARVELKDGAIKGINLAEAIRKAKAALGSKQEQTTASQAQQTDFSAMSASFVIKNGVAHNEDLDMKAPLFRIAGKGDINIGNSSLDYTTKATIVGTTQGQGGADLAELSGVTVPVHLSGPFDAMKYDVNYGAVAADLAKTKAGAQAKQAIEKNKDKIEQQLGGKLKGLLGR